MSGLTENQGLAQVALLRYYAHLQTFVTVQNMGCGMNNASLDEMVRAGNDDPSASEAFQALTTEVERRVREAAEKKKTQPNKPRFDYSWLDVEDVAMTAVAQSGRWWVVLRRNPSERNDALNQWVSYFLRDYCINILGDRAYHGGPGDKVRLIEELVNWTQAEVNKRKSAGSFANAEIDDVVQEVCLKVWKYLDQYKGQVAFSAWVRKIISHALIDAERNAPIIRFPRNRKTGTGQRKAKPRIIALDAPIQGQYDGAAIANVLGAIAGSDGRELVEADDESKAKEAIIRFIESFLADYKNKKHTAIFRLFYRDEFSFKQISKKVGISIGGIGAALNRMRLTIREAFKAAYAAGEINA